MGSRLTAGLLVALAAVSLTTGALLESGLPPPPSQLAFILLGLVTPALGWLLAVRRPFSPYGWLLLATAVFLGLGSLGAGIALAAGTPAGVPGWLTGLFAVYFGLNSIFVPLLFPEGRLPSRRWRPVAWISAGTIGAHALGVAAAWPVSGPQTPPVSMTAAAVGALGQALSWVMAVIVLVGLVVRWRRSAVTERGQYAWMVAGATANILSFVALIVFLMGGDAGWGLVGVTGTLGSLPAAVGVAIVRHRLLDIRIGIRGSRLLFVFDVRPSVGDVLSSLGSAMEERPEPAALIGRLAASVRSALETTWAAVRLADGTRVVAGVEVGPLRSSCRSGAGSASWSAARGSTAG
ncbi:hypothetical protein [Nonomuraea recticatena]|uniref:hypothetical protein n=1 Tax=Nonomuraea recticatena TaxID=46178 RepID=UPI00361848B7